MYNRTAPRTALDSAFQKVRKKTVCQGIEKGQRAMHAYYALLHKEAYSLSV